VTQLPLGFTGTDGPYDRPFNYAVVEGSFTFSLALQIAPDEVSVRPLDSAFMLIFS
jgi:hypothetical protein